MSDPAALAAPAPASPAEFDEAALQRLVRFGGAKLLNSMVGMFRTLGPQRVSTARAAVERGDIDAAKLEFHSLKSSAAQLGAEALGRLCGDAEALAKAGRLDALPATLPPVEAALERALAWMDRTSQDLATAG